MAERRSRKGESAATLAAVVASLGTAVGVFSSDAGAAEFLKQPAPDQLQPGAEQQKLRNVAPQGQSAQQLKLKGAAQQHKLEAPGAQQLKIETPAAQQLKLKGGAQQHKIESPAALQHKLEAPAAQQLKLESPGAGVTGDGRPATGR